MLRSQLYLSIPGERQEDDEDQEDRRDQDVKPAEPIRDPTNQHPERRAGSVGTDDRPQRDREYRRR